MWQKVNVALDSYALREQQSKGGGLVLQVLLRTIYSNTTAASLNIEKKSISSRPSTYPLAIYPSILRIPNTACHKRGGGEGGVRHFFDAIVTVKRAWMRGGGGPSTNPPLSRKKPTF